MKIIKEAKNPTFRITCEYCGTIFEYQQNELGYRPWYRHGFIYCPHCHRPLRHDPINRVDDVIDIEEHK